MSNPVDFKGQKIQVGSVVVLTAYAHQELTVPTFFIIPVMTVTCLISDTSVEARWFREGLLQDAVFKVRTLTVLNP